MDRKGRTVAHILKHHIPFDRVPYSCSLCSFRCLDKDTLVKHINQYKRHREEVRKAGGKVDHTKVLNRSSNPRFIGNDDMILLSREEPDRIFTSPEDPLEGLDGIFDEDDCESDPLSLPAWAREDVLTSSDNKCFPSFSTAACVGNRSPCLRPVLPLNSSSVLNTPPLVSTSPLIASKFPFTLVTSTSQSDFTSNYQMSDSVPNQTPLKTIALQDLYNMPNSMSSLGQFRKRKLVCATDDTPLLDERPNTDFDELLPNINHVMPTASNILNTDNQVIQADKRSIEQESHLESNKKAKQETFQQQPNQTLPCPPIDFNSIAATF